MAATRQLAPRGRASGSLRHDRRRRGVSTRGVLFALLGLVTFAAVACTPPSGGGHGGGGGTMYAVTVVASSPTTTYGGAIPAITAGYVNLPPGQTHPPTSATCSTTATSSSPAGTYPTTCAGAAGTNETFTYVAGAVTITPAPVIVTASSASIGLGDPIPPITASYSGLKNGDTAPATLPTCGTPADVVEPARCLSDDLLGCGRPELHLLLQRRHARHRHRGGDRDRVVGHVDVRRSRPAGHRELLGLPERPDPARHAADLHHLGQRLVAGRVVRDLVLGCGRRQLHVRVPGRHRHHHARRGDHHRVVEHLLVRVPGPVGHPDLLGPDERRHRRGDAADVLDHRHLVELRRHLSDDLLGRLGSELHVQLRERRRHDHSRRCTGHGDRLVRDDHLRRRDPRDHTVLLRVHGWADHPGHGADLHDDGDRIQPGRDVSDVLLRRRRSELHVRHRRRHGHDPEGTGHRHGVVRQRDLRRNRPRGHAVVLRPRPW